MKISIIIPIYGVEPYIETCLNLVYNQTYKDLEVILVNDCTPDNSMQIVKRLITDKGIVDGIEVKIVEHKTNRGLAAARNTGMKAATGEYLFFLDSDDWLPDNSIESLVRLVEKYPQVDIVHGNYHYTDSSKEWLELKDKMFPEFVNDKQWILDHILMPNKKGIIYGTVHNKLIRREMVLRYGMWFKEGMIHEDEYWKYTYADKWESIAFCLDYTYTYVSRDNSIMTSMKDMTQSNLTMLSIFSDFLKKPLCLSKENYKNLSNKILWLVYQYGITDYNSYSVKYRQTMREFARYDNLPFNVRLCFYYMSLPRFFVRSKVLRLFFI
jgi:glycosyltransferase involved in cell wall biosynthesis